MSTFLFEVKRGDTVKLLITCTYIDTNGAVQPLNLTGAEVWFTAKTDLSLADNGVGVIQKSIAGGGVVVTSPASGLAIITISPADTSGNTTDVGYQCDIQVKESDGVVSTVATGVLLVSLDATRAA